MVLIVVFSYNRAMQLDYLLKSIKEKFVLTSYEIAVVYHYTGKHKEGYDKLINDYVEQSSILFYERKAKYINIKSFLPTLYNFENLKSFIKYNYPFNKKNDNFKELLQNILTNTKCEYVMFNTDDGFFFDDVYIPMKILDMIESNPLQTSYRLYVGENLDEFPNYLNKIDNEFYKWNYYEKNKITHWTYPFAVDGTIYYAKSVLKILKKVSYHNPVTLESKVVSYVKRNKLLSTGLSPITSKLIGTKLNRVATNTANPTIHINPDILNDYFVKNYELKLIIPKVINNANVVPLEVSVFKAGEVDILYKINEEGEKIQNLLGVEGAKHQLI